jgi:anthranilate synthase/aminodeoxychorismate synthase-like glutamine amidotransferase
MKRPSLVLIDNYDSFTHILAHSLIQAGADVEVLRNDANNYEAATRSGFAGVVVSPGPGRPEESGIASSVIDRWTGISPILGVCLGHQLLAHKRGAAVEAKSPVHGRTSTLVHRDVGLFDGLPARFRVARYHSLRVETSDWPASLRITATAEDDPSLVLGFDDVSSGWHAVQFHPESHLTEHGPDVLRRFVSLCR